MGSIIVRGVALVLKPVSSWVELQRVAADLSVLLLGTLREKAGYLGGDPAELYKLGRVTLDSLVFRRSLLEKRPGPKWREEKQLQKMERRLGSIMARIEKNSRKYDHTDITRAFKELAHFQKQRNLLAGS